MINTSKEYKEALLKNRKFIAKATCILKDGTRLDFNQTNLMSGGVSITDAVSSSGKFDIGAAIINQLTLRINNSDLAYSKYVFTDAQITIWIGLQMEDRVIWLKKGVFNASDPTNTPSVITLKALDNMSKFDEDYDGNLGFPNTLQGIIQYCCSRCGVLLADGRFQNYGYIIKNNPFSKDSKVTYRAIISYCAMIAGCFARCNVDGKLELKWYDTGALSSVLDGGDFIDYVSGSTANGGDFLDYSTGNAVLGGDFESVEKYHELTSLSSLSTSTEDVVITGIRVTSSENTDNKTEETYLAGTEGYVLSLSKNPLIQPGTTRSVADFLASRIVGVRFRPLKAGILSDPAIEAGDVAVVTDRKGSSYPCYITNLSYTIGSCENISCDAEPPVRHSANRHSHIEEIVEQLKQNSKKQLSEYTKYLEQMNGLAMNAMGYYETIEIQDDGSKIVYMHDMPRKEESKVIYKKSIDGYFWSKDGGNTWIGGIGKDGNAVMNVIAATGISFDWAHGGTLTLGGDNNTNGLLRLLDSQGKIFGTLANDGLKIFNKKSAKGEYTLLNQTGLYKYDGKVLKPYKYYTYTGNFSINKESFAGGGLLETYYFGEVFFPYREYSEIFPVGFEPTKDNIQLHFEKMESGLTPADFLTYSLTNMSIEVLKFNYNHMEGGWELKYVCNCTYLATASNNVKPVYVAPKSVTIGYVITG